MSPSDSTSPSPAVEPVERPERHARPRSTRTSTPSDVPPEALIPPGTSVTDVWYADLARRHAVPLVAFVDTERPTRSGWSTGSWCGGGSPVNPSRGEPVFGLLDPPERGVLELHALIGDATGDGSPDALTFEDTGGSGACGTWRVHRPGGERRRVHEEDVRHDDRSLERPARARGAGGGVRARRRPLLPELDEDVRS